MGVICLLDTVLIDFKVSIRVKNAFDALFRISASLIVL
jgi:hypothetical protein